MDGLVRDCYVDDGMAMTSGVEDVKLIKEWVEKTGERRIPGEGILL